MLHPYLGALCWCWSWLFVAIAATYRRDPMPLEQDDE